MEECPELFTDAWARAFCAELAANPRYRQAAQGWEGAIGMVLGEDPEHGVDEDRPIILDLWHGACRGARAAGEEDLEAAPFVLSAPGGVWRRIFGGDLDPIFALMSGKLTMPRGTVARLLPYTAAAKEMVATARRVKATLPPGWEPGH